MSEHAVKSHEEMRADAHHTLTEVQGFRHVEGDYYDGGYYHARITDRPGMTELGAYLLGLRKNYPPDPDAYTSLIIEYFRPRSQRAA